MEESISRLRELPMDERGRADLPDEVPGDPEPPRPAPLAASSAKGPDPKLLEMTASEVDKAISVGALVPIGSAVHDRRRKWHRLLGVWRSCGARARLISDLRPANRLQRHPPTFRLPSPADARWLSARWGAKLDLCSAFWTIELSDRAARAMSTRTAGNDLEWRAMPFGWTWAPLVFQRALDPLVEFLRLRHPSVQFFKYLDDFLVISPSRADCAAAFEDLWSSIEDLGFQVSEEKSSTEPVQDIEFLGVRLDFGLQESSWPLRHASAVADLAGAIAANPRPPLPVVRRFLGKLAFLSQLCPVLAVWRRPIDDDVASHLAGGGGEAAGVPLSAASVAAASWWSTNAIRLSGRAFPWPAGTRFVVRCDASEWAGGVTLVLPDGTTRRTTVLLPPWLLGESSGAREFHVAVQAMQFLRAVVGDRPLMRAHVDVYSDSTASCGALRRGARAIPMREDGRRLVDTVVETGATVSATWLPREQLDAEDAGSRRVRFADARLHPTVEGQVMDWAWGHGMRPTLDAFATAANTRAPSWCSMHLESGASGVDGVRAPWPGPRVWAYPPAALARRVRIRAVQGLAAGQSLVLVGPQGVVELGAVRTMELPRACVLLPPAYAGPAVEPPLRLVAALFGSAVAAAAPAPPPSGVRDGGGAGSPVVVAWREVLGDALSGAPTGAHVVHGVSARAEMGAGFALQVRSLCSADIALIRCDAARALRADGSVEPRAVLSPRSAVSWFAHCVNKPTADHVPSEDSVVAGFARALVALAPYAPSSRRIHMPRMGCGLDGLNWSRLGPRLRRAAEEHAAATGVAWQVTVFS